MVSTAAAAPDVYGYYDEIISWIAGNDWLMEISSISGSAVAELLSGTTSNDLISASAGSDTILGGAGEDIIYGNTETDLTSGGAGSDTLYGGQNNGPASTGIELIRWNF